MPDDNVIHLQPASRWTLDAYGQSASRADRLKVKPVHFNAEMDFAKMEERMLAQMSNVMGLSEEFLTDASTATTSYGRTAAAIQAKTAETAEKLRTVEDHFSSQLKKTLYASPIMFKGQNAEYINGQRFVIDDRLCCFQVPNKLHRKTKRMSDSYHRRIQKKWNKRHGMTVNDHSYFTNGVMIVSSRTLNELKKGQGYATD